MLLFGDCVCPTKDHKKIRIKFSFIHDLSEDRRIDAVIDDNILSQSYVRQKGSILS